MSPGMILLSDESTIRSSSPWVLARIEKGIDTAKATTILHTTPRAETGVA